MKIMNHPVSTFEVFACIQFRIWSNRVWKIFKILFFFRQQAPCLFSFICFFYHPYFSCLQSCSDRRHWDYQHARQITSFALRGDCESVFVCVLVQHFTCEGLTDVCMFMYELACLIKSKYIIHDPFVKNTHFSVCVLVFWCSHLYTLNAYFNLHPKTIPGCYSCFYRHGLKAIST